ncbi:MAG: heme ABC exporter ATP-binding protein CcmA [Promethearchaeota archaeon]
METRLKDDENNRNGNTILAVNNVTMEYPGTVALNNVSFSINKGEIFTLIGPNGAGKTTLVKLITGQIKPTSGAINIAGYEPLKSRKRLHRMIGLVTQEISLYEELSARENLKFHASLFGIPKKLSRERINSALELVGLKERQDDMVSTYSGGMKRRLQLVRALLHDPELIILDEPTLGIDVQSRHAINKHVKELVSAGKTILLTTNYLDEAEKLSDRIIILDNRVVEGPASLSSIQKKVFPGRILEFVATPVDRARDLLKNFTAMKVEQETIVESETVDGHLRFIVQLPASESGYKVGMLLEHAKKEGVLIDELAIKSPDLEDVFLKLTGKAFRE